MWENTFWYCWQKCVASNTEHSRPWTIRQVCLLSLFRDCKRFLSYFVIWGLLPLYTKVKKEKEKRKKERKSSKHQATERPWLLFIPTKSERFQSLQTWFKSNLLALKIAASHSQAAPNSHIYFHCNTQTNTPNEESVQYRYSETDSTQNSVSWDFLSTVVNWFQIRQTRLSNRGNTAAPSESHQLFKKTCTHLQECSGKVR